MKILNIQISFNLQKNCRKSHQAPVVFCTKFGKMLCQNSEIYIILKHVFKNRNWQSSSFLVIIDEIGLLIDFRISKLVMTFLYKIWPPK